MKVIITLIAIFLSNLSLASEIKLRDDCTYIEDYPPSQLVVDAILECMYQKRSISGFDNSRAAKSLELVSPLYDIDVDKLTQSMKKEDGSYGADYMEILIGQSMEKVSDILIKLYEEQGYEGDITLINAMFSSDAPDDWQKIYKSTVGLNKRGVVSDALVSGLSMRLDGLMRDPERASNDHRKSRNIGKCQVEMEAANDKYYYLHFHEEVIKKDPLKYIDDASKKLSDLEASRGCNVGEDVRLHYRSHFNREYSKLGDYARDIAGEPARAVDFYLKAVEYKIIPIKREMTKNEERRHRERRKEVAKFLRMTGMLGDKPGTPCYKVYEIYGVKVGKEHKFYRLCKDELKVYGVNLIGVDGDFDIESRLAPKKRQFTISLSHDNKNNKAYKKVLIKSSYSNWSDIFCSELQLVETDSEGLAEVTVRDKRTVEFLVLDKDWVNDWGKNISTFKSGDIYVNVKIYPKSSREGMYNSSVMRGVRKCREQGYITPALVNIYRQLYTTSKAFSIEDGEYRSKNASGHLKNLVFSMYYNEINHADELDVFQLRALRRMALADERLDKSILYDMEKGLIIDEDFPFQKFLKIYGKDALHKYFGDECSYTSDALHLSSAKGIDLQAIDKLIYMSRGQSTIHKRSLTKDRERYVRAKERFNGADVFHSKLLAFSLKNGLAFRGGQESSSCNKHFIDKYFENAINNKDVDGIKAAFELGVSPDYLLQGKFPLVSNVTDDFLLSLFELGLNPKSRTASGDALFNMVLTKKHLKVLTYYIENNMVGEMSSKEYVQLLTIDFASDKINSKLLAAMVDSPESEHDKVIQAAALTSRHDVLEAMFDAGVKIKTHYESPLIDGRSSYVSSREGTHEESLILTSLDGEYDGDTIKTIDILHRNGANINGRGVTYTPLSYALNHGSHDEIAKIMSFNPVMNSVISEEETLLLKVSKHSFSFSEGCFRHLPEIASAIDNYLKHEPDGEKSYDYARCNVYKINRGKLRDGSDYDHVLALIEGGVDVNARSKYGDRTPLMFYALRKDMKVVNLLLKHGADPEAKDTYGHNYRDYLEEVALQPVIQPPTGRAYLGGGKLLLTPATTATDGASSQMPLPQSGGYAQ
ncbi:MAG: hypothetical protein OEZ16_08425 [Chromatiales bacterium]|nr:hypothetical protein [Chromatiales bacterium]